MKPIITHISTAHQAFDVRIFHKQCQSLSKNNFNVNLVVRHEKNEIVNGVRIIALPEIKHRFFRMFLMPWISLVKALQTKANIFHFHDPELIPIGIILRLCGKKVIYDVHEDVASQILNKNWIPAPLRKIVSLSVRLIEIVGTKIFSGVVTATPHIESLFNKINKNTAAVNNYPLLTESIAPDFSNKEKNSICYVGGISKERGILELIKALEGTNITLHLAGNFSNKDLENEARGLTGWGNVNYLGLVNRSQLQNIFKKSMIGICLFHKIENHKYCLPNKIFEYWNSSLIILASDIPYWQNNFINSNAIEFVNPYSSSSIREKLSLLLECPQKIFDRGKLGQQDVLANYNWNTEFQKILILYEKILSNK